eukprot:5909896-Pleurochrysis_carterae.AAC.1
MADGSSSLRDKAWSCGKRRGANGGRQRLGRCGRGGRGGCDGQSESAFGCAEEEERRTPGARAEGET